MSDEIKGSPFSSGGLPVKTPRPEVEEVEREETVEQVADAATGSQIPTGDNAPTNKLAIVSLISSFFISILGLITGIVALKQIKRTGEKGRGLALAGTIIGSISLVATIVVTVLFLVLGFGLVNAVNNGYDSDLSPAQQSQIEDDGYEFREDGTIVNTETGEVVEPAEITASSEGSREPEFCTQLAETIKASAEMADLPPGSPAPESVLKSFEALAAIDSPNADAYAEFAKFLANPAEYPTEKLDGTLNNFGTASTYDEAACA